MQKFSDSNLLLTGASSADIVTPLNTAFVAPNNARLFGALVHVGAVAATKTVTIQFRQATDASGTAAKNLGTAYVVTAPGGGWTTKDLQLDASFNDLDDANGFDFIGVQISSNNTSATPASVSLVGSDNRFRP